jgi:hypothetical protein
MPKYKECLRRADTRQSELLTSVNAVDPRVDKPLLSKFVNNVCLPTPPQLDAICGALNCTVVELYDRSEVDLLKDAPPEAVKKRNRSKRNAARESKIYNLTVELDREVAERVLNPEALKQLGYNDKSDFVRKHVAAAAARLEHLQRKSRPGVDTPKGG